VSDLLDHRRQGLRVGDAAVSDPSLIATQTFPDGLEFGFGSVLLGLQVADSRLGGNEIGRGCGHGSVECVDLGMLRQGLSAVLELGNRGVDGLQVEQAELRAAVSFDGGSPCLVTDRDNPTFRGAGE
jgi:hypothetical protein